MASVKAAETKPHHTPGQKNTAKEDPLEIMRRKFLAKCRFRALVRRVINNLHWLLENEEVYEGDNVKKRVEQAMRAKSQKKSLLDLKDKALLNKPAIERTDQEKKYIYRKIGGLKCFKRYPNYVKRKLAAATYFVYYGPNRVIVRQHQEAHALYFVVTGEVVVSVMIFDELTQKHHSLDVFVMHPGDMFAHCEFLALMKRDFKIVLQDSLQKQWEEVKQAMSSFTYFDGLDEVSRREGCIVAKMKSFEPDDTILGDGAGLANFVYFVLSGRCQMIESLKIREVTSLGKKRFSLENPLVIETEDDHIDFDKKYFKNLNPKSDSSGTSKTVNDSKKLSTEPTNESQESDTETKLKESEQKVKDRTGKDSTKISSVEESDSRKADERKVSVDKPCSKRFSITSSKSHQATGFEMLLNEDDVDSNRTSVQDVDLKNIRTYFMQVCIFNPGSTFGFGENMRDRRIVALTRVDCMLLPKMWLLQKNTANIWSRIQHYLEKKIPTKKQLFKKFVQQRRWLKWRDDLVQQIVDRSKTVNHTTLHDVPYSIRMQEQID